MSGGSHNVFEEINAQVCMCVFSCHILLWLVKCVCDMREQPIDSAGQEGVGDNKIKIKSNQTQQKDCSSRPANKLTR